MHDNTWMLFEKRALSYFKDGCDVMEIGPDRDPSTLQQFVEGKYAKWDTLDLTRWLVNTTYIATTPYSYPIDSDKYDIVLSAQVIQSVPHLWRWMPELKRIC